MFPSDENDSERPVPPARLSKTPSWITLGFVLGALFVFALPDGAPPAAPAKAPARESAPVRLERPSLTEIEAVFADWGESAIWQSGTTEVALWDREKRSYSIFYEVIREGGHYYFRSIPRLTRPLLTQGVPENSPLQYTMPLGVRDNRPPPDGPSLRAPADPGRLGTIRSAVSLPRENAPPRIEGATPPLPSERAE